MRRIASHHLIRNSLSLLPPYLQKCYKCLLISSVLTVRARFIEYASSALCACGKCVKHTTK